MKEGGNNAALNASEKPLGFKTYISYALGDTGDNIMFGTMANIITLFYTDYVGISPAKVALVLLISRFLDGASDFIAGIIMSKTKSKWGHCRSWLLWITIPFSIACVACFTVPQGSESMQFWYIFIAYNFANAVCYTFSNLAQATLCSFMSRDSKEREKLGVWRLGLAPVGHIISSAATIPLVKILGNNQAAWVKVMTLWAIYALVVHFVCFLNCKEVVKIDARDKAKDLPILTQLRALVRNQYWWWAISYWTLWATTFGVNGTLMSYFSRYVLNNDSIYSGLFITEKIMWGVGILSMLFIRQWSKLSRRSLLVIGCGVVIVGHLLLLINPYSIPLNYLAVVLRGLGQGPTSAFFNGMVADVVEFGQWKTHQRQETLVFSASSVGQKVGGGLILSLMTALIGASGFIASTTGGTEQPVSAISCIMNLYIWAPIIIYALLGFVCYCNRLDSKLPTIMTELNAREARGEL